MRVDFGQRAAQPTHWFSASPGLCMTASPASSTFVPAAGHRITVRPADAYAVAADAQRRVSRDAADAGAWEALVAAHAALSLRTPLRRLLERAPLPSDLRAAFAAELSGTERRVSWSALARRFEANLAGLRRHTAQADAMAAAWRRRAARLELYEDGESCAQVADRDAGADGLWLPALHPHHALVQRAALRQQWEGRVVRSLVVSGLGMGYLASDVFAASERTLLQFSPVVALIEPSLTAWAVVLHLHDWTGLLSSARIRVGVGIEAQSVFDALLADTDRHCPAIIPGGAPWGEGPDSAALARAVEVEEARRMREREERFARISGQVRSACIPGESTSQSPNSGATAQVERIRRAASGGLALRVLGVTSRFTTVLQYSMRDWLAAFERAGHATRVVIEPDDHAHFSAQRVQAEIEAFSPDLVLLIDHLRHEYPHTIPHEIPSVCWIQDNLPNLFRPEAGRAVGEREVVIGHGFDECVGRFGYPAARFLPVRIPCDPTRLCDPSETEADLAPYRCDVMFASNHRFSYAQRRAQAVGRFGGTAGEVFSRALVRLEEDMRHPWFDGYYNFDALVARTLDAMELATRDAALRNELTGELLTLADIHLREQTVRDAARWAVQSGRRLNLYGNGWREHPEFSAFARGPVAHGVELGRAVRAAKVCLHTGCNSALHQRVLDTLAAGGFLLIRDKLGDTEHVRFSRQVAWYEQNRRATPFAMRASDLPPPLDEWTRRERFWGGLDPEGVVQVHESHVDWWYQRMHETRDATPSGIWPELLEVLYSGGDHLAQRLEHFVTAEQERQALAERMRAAVLERFTYDALVRDLLQFMGAALGRR
ncbi:MAG: glycosyltransferase family 1 protein [Phycisphaerales bacterium]|nr:glycosyltransferase family 1 protein [Phycisphaerales bacterium]